VLTEVAFLTCREREFQMGSSRVHEWLAEMFAVRFWRI